MTAECPVCKEPHRDRVCAPGALYRRINALEAMSEYKATTAEIKDASSVEGSTGIEPEVFDRWLNQVKADAWDAGQKAEERAWEHAISGHPVLPGETCQDCDVSNPYRQGVDKRFPTR